MQRQRGELVPIGEVVADLDGPVKAIREASPQEPCCTDRDGNGIPPFPKR